MPFRPVFGSKRFWILLRNAVWLGRSKILLAAVTGGALVVLFSGLTAFAHAGDQVHLRLYPVFLFMGGLLATSHAFRDLQDGGTAAAFMTLPASALEKFASRLVLTSIGYIAGSLVFYALAAALSEIINHALFGFSHPWFNPLHPSIRRWAALYFVTQSVFFTGAVFFRRFVLIKTTLFLSLLHLVLFILTVSALRWALGSDVSLFFTLGPNGSWQSVSPGGVAAALDTLWTVLRTLFWFALAPLCWLIGYFRLKNIEV